MNEREKQAHEGYLAKLANKYGTTPQIVEKATKAFSGSNRTDSAKLSKTFPNGCTLGDAIKHFRLEAR